ncbi:unnamed protein product [Sympodiomycopsis kandeliae]
MTTNYAFVPQTNLVERTLRKAKSVIHRKDGNGKAKGLSGTFMEAMEACPNVDYPTGAFPSKYEPSLHPPAKDLQASTTSISNIMTQRLIRMGIAVSNAKIDRGWSHWSEKQDTTVSLAKDWAQLIETFCPWPSESDDTAKTFPPLLKADPFARLSYIDLAISREQYQTIAFTLTTLAWCNADLWRMCEAVRLCHTKGSATQKQQFEEILKLIGPHENLQWEETSTRVPGRPELAAVGTADWTLFLIDLQDPSRNQIIALGEGKPGTKLKDVEKFISQWPFDKGSSPLPQRSAWNTSSASSKIEAQLASQLVFTNTRCGFLLYDHFRRMAFFKLSPESTNVTSMTLEALLSYSRGPSVFSLNFNPETIESRHHLSAPKTEQTPPSYAFQPVKGISLKTGLPRATMKFLSIFRNRKRLFPKIESDNIAKEIVTRERRRRRGGTIGTIAEEAGNNDSDGPGPGDSSGGDGTSGPSGPHQSPHDLGPAGGSSSSASPQVGSAHQTGPQDSSAPHAVQSGATVASLAGINAGAPSDAPDTSGSSGAFGDTSIPTQTSLATSVSGGSFQADSGPPAPLESAPMLVNDEYEIEEEHFESGASSTCHKIFLPPSSTSSRILKVFRTPVGCVQPQQLYQNEVAMLLRLRSSQLVPHLYGVISAEEYPPSLTPKLVLEDAGLGLDWWMYEKATTTKADNGHFLHQRLWSAVDAAVDALHDHDVVHQDLSINNIRAAGDRPPRVKIIDFDRALTSQDDLLRKLDHAAASHACNLAVEAVFGDNWAEP